MVETKGKKAQEEDEWDKKKIVVALTIIFVLLVLGLALKDMILGSSYAPKTTQKIVSQPQIDVKKNVQDQVNALQKEAENINLVDVATSSPQVQKVIHDLQGLKDYPNNQIKQTCVNICSKL